MRVNKVSTAAPLSVAKHHHEDDDENNDYDNDDADADDAVQLHHNEQENEDWYFADDNVLISFVSWEFAVVRWGRITIIKPFKPFKHVQFQK